MTALQRRQGDDRQGHEKMLGVTGHRCHVGDAHQTTARYHCAPTERQHAGRSCSTGGDMDAARRQQASVGATAREQFAPEFARGGRRGGTFPRSSLRRAFAHTRPQPVGVALLPSLVDHAFLRAALRPPWARQLVIGEGPRAVPAPSDGNEAAIQSASALTSGFLARLQCLLSSLLRTPRPAPRVRLCVGAGRGELAL